MFQKINKTEGGTASINLIGAGTSIIGDVTSTGDVRIDGSLKGNITISGKLVIGTTGKIEGDITCQNADVSGELIGKATIKELLQLKANSKLIGDIFTSQLSIEPTAIFEGHCKRMEQ